MSFDAAAFGPITLNHLPPFAQRLRHAVHVETRMGRVRRTMDERWARALRAKGIDIDEADGAGGKRAHDANGIPTSRVLVDAPRPSRLPGSAVDPIPVRICRGRR